MGGKSKSYATWFVPAPIEPNVVKLARPKRLPKLFQNMATLDQEKASWALLKAGRTLRTRGEYSHALQYLSRARESFEGSQDDYGIASTFLELAFCSGELSRNATAFEYAQQAVAKFEQLGRGIEVAWANENLAYIYFYRFQYKESLSYAKAARQIFLELNSQNGLAWNACNIARIYLEMCQPFRARYYYEEAFKIFSKLKSQQGKALCLLGLGNVYRGLCRYALALKYLARAREIYAALNINDHVGWCLLNEASIHRILGRVERSIIDNNKAIHIFSALKKQDGVGWGLFQVGRGLRESGFCLKSWQTLREGLNLHKDISSRKGIGWGENDLGLTYLELGDVNRAKECFATAITMAKEMEAGPLHAEAEKNLSMVFQEQGQLREAQKYIEGANDRCQTYQTWEILPDIYLQKARLAYLMGDFKEVAQALRRAAQTVEEYDLHIFRPMLRLAAGELLIRQGKRDQAVNVWMEALDLSKKMKQKAVYVETLLSLAQALEGKKKAAQIVQMLYQIEKDVRLMSSRKLKAKGLAVRSWVTFRESGFLETRHIAQAVQIANTSGLILEEKFLLELWIYLLEQAKDEKEAAACRVTLQALHERKPDLALMAMTPVSGCCPVSAFV